MTQSFTEFVNSLPGDVSGLLLPAKADGDEQLSDTSYRDFICSLPEVVQKTLQRDQEKSYRYGVIEVPDDGWPYCRLFHSLEAAAKHVAGLQGRDICVILFEGRIYPITKGVRRYIIIPGSDNAVKLPIVEDEEVEVTPIPDPRPEIEECGFLGLPELYDHVALSDAERSSHKPTTGDLQDRSADSTREDDGESCEAPG